MRIKYKCNSSKHPGMGAFLMHAKQTNERW
nr:MAG TPA: hypothetical protein [Caudoviricetes sp.]